MSLKTQRTTGFASVTIDQTRCATCGSCVEVCKGAPLRMEKGRVVVDQSELFGCMACGHCMAVCPQDCIQVEGRDLSPDDMFGLPPAYAQADYESVMALFQTRRSVRNFTGKTVPREVLNQIIAAVATAPMGIPPSDVEVLVFDGKQATDTFTKEVVRFLRSVKWVFSDQFLWLLRPFMGKETTEMFRSFMAVAINAMIEKHDAGENWLTYDAPCALYFYTSPYADPADPLIAATYAMIAAESLGLGSCLLGTIPYCFKYSRKLRQQYQVSRKSQQGIMLLLGCPSVDFKKGVHRRLSAIRFVE